MKTPVVLIHSGAGASLDRFYEGIKAQLDAKYHQPGNCFPNIHPTEAELADQVALSNYAAHASDGLITRGDYASTDGGKTWTHIERLIK